MLKISKSESKVVPAKRTIKISDVFVSELRFVDDENGDITSQVLDAIPDGVDKVSFSITVELPSEDSSEE